LRSLFSAGAEADSAVLSPSDAINPYWTKLSDNLTARLWNFPISIVHWPEQNRIYSLFPGHIAEDGTYSATSATMFVYNTVSKAWMFHKLENVDPTHMGGLTYYNNNIYFFTDTVVMKVDPTKIKDELYSTAATWVSYDCPLQSAYMNLGSGKRSKLVRGFEPIIRTDFTGSLFGMKAAADFGRTISSASKPALRSGYSIPHYGCGVEGSFIQYRFDGYPDGPGTIGMELFSVGAIVA
jgi:hypothetical protein